MASVEKDVPNDEESPLLADSKAHDEESANLSPLMKRLHLVHKVDEGHFSTWIEVALIIDALSILFQLSNNGVMGIILMAFSVMCCATYIVQMVFLIYNLRTLYFFSPAQIVDFALVCVRLCLFCLELMLMLHRTASLNFESKHFNKDVLLLVYTAIFVLIPATRLILTRWTKPYRKRLLTNAESVTISKIEALIPQIPGLTRSQAEIIRHHLHSCVNDLNKGNVSRDAIKSFINLLYIDDRLPNVTSQIYFQALTSFNLVVQLDKVTLDSSSSSSSKPVQLHCCASLIENFHESAIAVHSARLNDNGDRVGISLSGNIAVFYTGEFYLEFYRLEDEKQDKWKKVLTTENARSNVPVWKLVDLPLSTLVNSNKQQQFKIMCVNKHHMNINHIGHLITTVDNLLEIQEQVIQLIADEIPYRPACPSFGSSAALQDPEEKFQKKVVQPSDSEITWNEKITFSGVPSNTTAIQLVFYQGFKNLNRKVIIVRFEDLLHSKAVTSDTLVGYHLSNKKIVQNAQITLTLQPVYPGSTVLHKPIVGNYLQEQARAAEAMNKTIRVLTTKSKTDASEALSQCISPSIKTWTSDKKTTMYLAATVVCAVGVAAVSPAVAYFTEMLVDQGLKDQSIFLVACIGICCVWIYEGFINFLLTYVSCKLSTGGLATLRKNTFEAMLDQEVQPGHGMIDSFGIDFLKIGMLHNSIVACLLVAGLKLIFVFSYLFYQDIVAGFIGLGFILLTFTSGPNHRTTAAVVKAGGAQKRATSSFEEGLQGHAMIRIYDIKETASERFAVVLEDLNQAEFGKFFWGASSSLHVATMMSFFLTVELLTLGLEARESHISLGEFLALFSMYKAMVGPVTKIGAWEGQVGNALVFLRVNGYINDTKAKKQREELERGFHSGTASKKDRKASPTPKIGELETSIVLKDVTFHYSAQGKNVLEGLNLTLERGKLHCITGAKATGKTTLLRLLLRLESGYSGSVQWDGLEINSMKREEYWKHVAVLDSNADILNGTIEDNIKFGKLDATEEEIEDAAKHALLYPAMTNLPLGLKSKVGVLGEHQLTESQKCRIAIARALVSKPSLLCLDQITACLEEHEIVEMIDAMHQLTETRGITIIMTSDREYAQKQADVTMDMEALNNFSKKHWKGVKKALISDKLLTRDIGAAPGVQTSASESSVPAVKEGEEDSKAGEEDSKVGEEDSKQ